MRAFDHVYLLSTVICGREHGGWTAFDARGQQAVEAAFAAGQRTAQSSLFNPRMNQTIVYDYDLVNMQQVRPASF